MNQSYSSQCVCPAVVAGRNYQRLVDGEPGVGGHEGAGRGWGRRCEEDQREGVGSAGVQS